MEQPGASGTVTILFTDLVGSTELLSSVGDEAAEDARRLHFGILRTAIAANAGQEVKSLGDGVMVVFSSALDALHCAVAMQEGMREHNHADDVPCFDLRIGLHAGEPIRAEGDYFGTPVVVASRLCNSAVAGEIRASSVIRALVGTRGHFTFAEIGDVNLKGLTEPVAADRVIWNGAPASAGTPIAGSAAALGQITPASSSEVAPGGGGIRIRRRPRASIALLGVGVVAAGIVTAIVAIVAIGGSDGDAGGAAVQGALRFDQGRSVEGLHYRDILSYPDGVLESTSTEELDGHVRVTTIWLTRDPPERIFAFYEAALFDLGVRGDPSRVSARGLETLSIGQGDDRAVIIVEIGTGPAQENRIVVGFSLQ